MGCVFLQSLNAYGPLGTLNGGQHDSMNFCVNPVFQVPECNVQCIPSYGCLILKDVEILEFALPRMVTAVELLV